MKTVEGEQTEVARINVAIRPIKCQIDPSVGDVSGGGRRCDLAIDRIQIWHEYLEVIALIIRPGVLRPILIDEGVVNIHCADDRVPPRPKRAGLGKDCIEIGSEDRDSCSQAILIVYSPARSILYALRPPSRSFPPMFTVTMVDVVTDKRKSRFPLTAPRRSLLVHPGTQRLIVLTLAPESASINRS